jgi:hypothetical protein
MDTLVKVFRSNSARHRFLVVASALAGGFCASTAGEGPGTLAPGASIEMHVVPPAALGRPVPLSPLAAAAEALVIRLGEASHGSRELNDVRLSLVKRLNEEHGYRAVALEDSSVR